MLNRLITEELDTQLITDQELIMYCAVNDPSALPLLRDLSITAQQWIETYCSNFITQRSIRWVMARGEQEKTDIFFRSFLSTRSYVASGFNTIAGQWVNFPTSAISVESVQIGIWGQPTIQLVEGQDYAVDLLTDPARLTLTYNLAVQDYFINFDSMVVDYTGGMAASGFEPKTVKLAIKMLTKKLYDSRGEDIELLTPGVEALLTNHRYYGFGGSR